MPTARLLGTATLLLLLPWFAPGCTTPSQSYEVEVINKTAGPLSVGLVRSGAAASGWTGPEHVLMGAPALAHKRWGALIPPGRSKVVAAEGGFTTGVYFRAYASDGTIEELASFDSKSIDRLDEPVRPGRSAYAVTDRTGRLTADEVPPAPQDPPTPKPQ